MEQWAFTAIGLKDRPIRQEEIYLLCQLLPPAVLSLIAYGEPELYLVDSDTSDSTSKSQLPEIKEDMA